MLQAVQIHRIFILSPAFVICELLGNWVTRASEIWRDTAFFQGASITPILLAIRLCSYFYYFWCF